MFFDTIAAISTPKGEGGISIIRISGSDSFKILDKIFKRKNLPEKDLEYSKMNYGYIYSKDGQIIDEAMVVRFRAPYTYTCEDVVEINCHGGLVVTRKILKEILSLGARLALSGEFTKRAFLNGRIDLTQAEAISEIITGRSENLVEVSMNHLRGDLKEKINEYKDVILNLAAHVNVVIDYPEEDVEEVIPNELKEKIKKVIKETDDIISSYDKGKKLKEGIKTAIIGKPNVGKSTLLNRLLREDRAIVTEIAGTTRDSIEEVINIKGYPLVLIDTAGIRETEDIVEKIGVDKSLKYLEDADLVLLVFDASNELEDKDLELIKSLEEKNKKYLLILNKIDKEIKIKLDNNNIIKISAKDNIGIDEMEEKIYRYITDDEIEATSDKIVITNIRHKASLSKTKDSLENIIDTINNGYPLDLVSVDIKEALDSLGEITGEITSEDILDKVFSNFCVGK